MIPVHGNLRPWNIQIVKQFGAKIFVNEDLEYLMSIEVRLDRS
jgi:hypothetical protein